MPVTNNKLMILPQHERAIDLETQLGNPFDAGSALSFKAAVETDESEAYPVASLGVLNDWGLSDYYVPPSLGGKFSSYEELLHLVRVVARRDLTVAVAHGSTYLGAIPVWMAGDAEQQSKLARLILGGAQISLGLTEQKHGSDLMAGSVEVRRDDTSYKLHGEKWLIGNATRGRALTVLARTDAEGGARGFTLLLIDKSAADASLYRSLPKVKTHGIRGADISGIRFGGYPVGPEAFVGEVGKGLEVVLKALQVTRTLCPGFSLGAADTALRLTLDFAEGRRLYNSTVLDIPYPRELLLESFLDLLICDCAAASAARALHTFPEQMSAWSAVVKTFVPTTVESLIQRLTVVLGARFYLREGHWDGIFQKILRDNAVVSLFDGSTAVNLEMLALQLRSRLRESGGRDTRAEANARGIALTYDLAGELPPSRFDAFDLMCRGADPVVAALSTMDEELTAACADLSSPIGDALRLLLKMLQDKVAALRLEVNAVTGSQPLGGRPSAQQFRLAQRYASLHAAATCLHMWLHNRHHLDSFFREGVWLILCLRRLLGSDAPQLDEATAARWRETAIEELLLLHRGNFSFSIVPLALSERRVEQHSFV